MKTLNLFLALMMILFTANRIFSQTVNTSAYLNSLPSIELDKSQARSYHIITDYYDFGLSGDFRVKTRIAGNLTCKNDSIRWKDVNLFHSKSFTADFSNGKKVDYVENFKYKQGTEIIPADFFVKNLPEADPLVMN